MIPASRADQKALNPRAIQTKRSINKGKIPKEKLTAKKALAQGATNTPSQLTKTDIKSINHGYHTF